MTEVPLVQPEFAGVPPRSRIHPLGVALALSLMLHGVLLALRADTQPSRQRMAGSAPRIDVSLVARSRPIQAATTGPADRPVPDRPSRPVENRTASAEAAETTRASERPSAAGTSAGPPGVAVSDLPDPGHDDEASDSEERAGQRWAQVAELADVQLPTFPPPVISWGEAVIVVIRIQLDGAGRVVHVEVLDSSGYPSLDDAAVESASRQRFSVHSVDRTLLRKVTFFDGDTEEGTAVGPYRLD